jgi:Flp pilus assembly protein CpaB
MPSDLDVGRRVDVYVVERGASGAADGPPQLVLRNAIVSSVDGDSGTFGGTSLEVGVALSLPDEQVAKVLDAQARGSLTLVDVPVASP